MRLATCGVDDAQEHATSTQSASDLPTWPAPVDMCRALRGQIAARLSVWKARGPRGRGEC